jgi:hypothetical protein
MNEDTSLPQPFSRMEIATIAAMLLGKFAKDSEYRSACESALNLLTIAEEVADKYDPDKHDMAAIFWERLDQSGSEDDAEVSIQEELINLGFQNGSKLDPESDLRIPWFKFSKDILHPKGDTQKREENFKAWLLSKFSDEEATSLLRGARDHGVYKKLVIMYLEEFEIWWKFHKSRKNSDSGKTGARKKKSMAKKKENAE